MAGACIVGGTFLEDTLVGIIIARCQGEDSIIGGSRGSIICSSVLGVAWYWYRVEGGVIDGWLGRLMWILP